MNRFVLILLFLLTFCFVSCSDDGNPILSSGSLFSITVLDAQGNPAEGLRVGSINHPIGGRQALDPDDFYFPKPCPSAIIQFLVPVEGDWEISIFDFDGRPIRSISGESDAGVVTIVWDGNNNDGNPVPNGFYRYHVVSGTFEAERWMVLERGDDPRYSIIGELDEHGKFATDDKSLFPGLLVPPGPEYYTDTVTIHLSNPDFPNDFFLFTTRLSQSGNNFSFVLDSLGLPTALVKILVVDTSGNPVPGIRVGSMNHHYIEQTRKSAQPNGSINISFQIPSGSEVLLQVFDYYRNLVKTLADDYYSAGNHSVAWDGKDEGGNEILSGYYEYELTTGDFNASKWMVYEKDPDQYPTIMGYTDSNGVVAVDDSLYFPALLGNPPVIMTYDELQNPLGYFHYSNTVTFTLSDPDVSSGFIYFERQLNVGLNDFQLTWDPDLAR